MDKNPAKYIMMPGNAIKRHPFVEERTLKLQEFAENCIYNTDEYATDSEIGIITSGCSYQYVKEVFGDSVSLLKIGLLLVRGIGKEIIIRESLAF